MELNIIFENVLKLGNIREKYIKLFIDKFNLEDIDLGKYLQRGKKTVKNILNSEDYLLKNLEKINFGGFPIDEKDKIVDFFYEILGYTEAFLDKETKVGVGYSIVLTILENIFGKIDEVEISPVKQKKYVITLTFGEVAENHVGMQQLGKIAKEGQGFNLADLENAKNQFVELGLECRIIDLIKAGKVENVKPPPQPAYVLVVKNGIKALTSTNFNLNKINKEVLKDSWDKKAFMKGRVVNKLARYNLNYADVSQEPDYENKKGRVVAFKDAPIVNTIRQNLPNFLGEKARNLFAEGNFYYDLTTTGIGYHGDSERRRVVAVRLGDSSIPLHYQWFQYSKPIGERIIINLEPGDVYVMSEIAVGTNWLKKIIPTLRHATGAKKYLEIKKK